MQILYFAWVREKIGVATEELSLQPGIHDIGGLIRHLATLSPGHAAAFANPSAIRAAINQDFASLSDVISDTDEIAFFPPVTGG